MHAADLDGDGRTDVVSAGYATSTVSWYRNEGGSPIAWTSFTVGALASPTSVFTADIDGDGRVDVLSTGFSGDKVTWFRNNGGSPLTWTSRDITSFAASAQCVFAADVDGDGRVDVLSASSGDNKIAWYRNSPGSPVTWTPEFITTTTVSNAQSVFAVDVDGDGRVDVLSASSADDKVAWYQNTPGTPVTWTTRNIAVTADGAWSVFAADLDGDGRVDVLSASTNDNRIAWYRNGGGSPPTWTTYNVSVSASGARSVYATDVDGDGRVDVLSASTNDNRVTWYRNGGGSPVTWTPYFISTAANGAYSVFATDVDGDGWVDVLSASVNDNKVAVYLSLGLCDVGTNGSAGLPPCTPCTPGRFADARGSSACAVCPPGRFSQAGAAACSDCPAGRYSASSGTVVCAACAVGLYGAVPGLASASCNGSCPVGRFSGAAGTIACRVSVAPAVAAPPLSPHVVSTSVNYASSVHAVDVDGDGRVDVLSTSFNDDKIAWYRNGGGSPPVWTPYTISMAADGAWSVYAADVDGDGRVDVLSASQNDDKIAWYRNGGGSPPTWTEIVISVAANGASSVYATDVDGDGRVDVLSASQYDRKIAWYKNGGGSPPTWTEYVISVAANGATSVNAADVDGDGWVDVLSASYSDDKIAWYRNGGGSPPTWTANTIASVADSAMSVFAADVDGDGWMDVLSASSNDDKIAWYKNSGGSPPSWTTYNISTVADVARSVYAADVDGDGRVDVLSASDNDRKIAWYRNGGGSPVTWTPYIISSAANGAVSVFATDVDGDGWVDVLSASVNDNKVAVYLSLGLCNVGTNGTAGIPPCTPCTPGRFADARGSSACAVCPPGRFSQAGAAACSDCPAGRYSASSGTVVCAACAVGLYGAVPGLASASCNGSCPVGRFSGAAGTIVCRVSAAPAVAAPSLSPHVVNASANSASSVYAADVDGDGRVDVLSASQGDDKIAWYRNGGGSPPVWTAYTISMTADGAASVYAADVDGDGRVDVLSASYNDDKIAWYRNGGGSPLIWTVYNISTTADGAASVHAADVDGDGRVDVLSASYIDDKVVWYRNGGGSPPTWTPYTITTSQNGPWSVVATDLDGDGRVDVVAASADDDRVFVYKNTLGSPVIWSPAAVTFTASNVRSVCTADVNRDGWMDVLSASQLDDKVAYYVNGTFPYTISTTADGARSVHAADVDGDGWVDVLSASSNDNKVAWYRSGGGSPVTLTAYAISTVAMGACAVHAVDVDGDGWVDVLSASELNGVINVHLSSGLCDRGSNGTTGAPPCALCPPGRYADARGTVTCAACAAGYACPVAGATNGAVSVCPAGRFSQAGAANCTACPSGQGALPGASSCYLCPAGRYAASGVCVACAAGQFGASVGLTLPVCSGPCPTGWFSGSGAIACRAVPGATLAAPVLLHSLVSAVAGSVQALVAADVDGDGWLDVVSAGSASRVEWYRNLNGSWAAAATVSSGYLVGVYSVFSADVDGDGRMDVLSTGADNGRVSWFKLDNGTWTAFDIASAQAGVWCVCAKDMDGDGDVDVVAAGGTLVVLYENGGGSPPVWSAYNVSTSAGSPRAVLAVDVDNDGVTDIVTANYGAGAIAWYERLGGPGSWSRYVVSASAANVSSLFAGDVDGDGRMDVVAANAGDTLNSVAWYRNTAGAPVSWTLYAISSTSNQATSVGAGDVDGDGQLDVVSGQSVNYTVGWHRSSGGALPLTWAGASFSTANMTGAVCVFLADMNNDGWLDLVTSSASGRVGVYTSSGLCDRGFNGTSGTPPCTRCPPGRYTDTRGAATCAACTAGYSCPTAGATNGTVSVCPAGQYSFSGAAVCTPCPGGTFGSAPGLASAACSGGCSPGFACPAGSTSSVAYLCPPGRFSQTGAAVCSDCPAGRYNASSGAVLCTACAVGLYGAVPGLASAACNGSCPVGRYSGAAGTIVCRVSATPAMAAPTLSPHVVNASASGALSVHAVDVDGDGRVDVLSANYHSDMIAWYRNGGGSPPVWTAYTISTTADGAASVYATDLDGDGMVDVLSASCFNDKIAWYRNGGGSPPSWMAHTISTVADCAQSVFAVDVDGDGRVDVLSASANDDKIAWYRNNGGGYPPTWTPYTISTTADGAQSVFAADVDGDGRVDALSASNNDDEIAWYRNGGGSPPVWTLFTISTAAVGAFAVLAADVDSDGRVDVLSASWADDKIAWYRNGGGSPPTWTPYTISTVVDGAYSVLTTDVDGDGRVDVLSAGYTDDKIAWYRNGGGSPPTWTAHSISTTADGAHSVFATDVDGDGWVDVLSASVNDNKVAVYLSSGLCDVGTNGTAGIPPCTPCTPGRFADARGSSACAVCPPGRFSLAGAAACSDCPAGRYSAAPGTGVCAACAVGLYGAVPGLASASCNGSCPVGRFSGAAGTIACRVSAAPAVAAPSLTPNVVSTSVNYASSVHAVDVDGDGRVDVLSASQGDDKIAWYRNGGGSPPVWTPYTISMTADGAWSVYAADVDGDGRVDVLSASNIDDKIAWYRNGGGSPPTWTEIVISVAANGASSVYATDVDGDGRVDVLSASQYDRKIAWYKNGGGSPPTWTEYAISVAANGATSVYAADVDGDGWVDVLSASSIDDKIAWYRNGGGSPPSWTEYAISTAADGARSVFATDVDGDGRVDVLSASSVDDKIAWYKNGGGSPLSWTMYAISLTANGAYSVYAADVDGDGRVDVLSASQADKKVAWYRSGGGSPPSWTAYNISAAADGAASVFATDVDGDGWVDVLSASQYDDTVAVYFSSGLCGVGTNGTAGLPSCAPCAAGRYAQSRGMAVCAVCTPMAVCAAGADAPGACGVGYLCPAGSGATPTAPAAACFASGSSVASWGTNATHGTLVTQAARPFGALVVAGLRTGFDVQCNGADAVARLPDSVAVAGLAAVALGPAGGAMVLVNGSAVVVSAPDAQGYFVVQAQDAGLPPAGRYTVACAVDVNADGAVDVVLGSGPGNTSAVLLGGAAGFVADAGLGAALTTAVGTTGVAALLAVAPGPQCPLGVSVVAVLPGAVAVVRLALNGSALSATSLGGSGGIAGVAVGDVTGDGVVDVVACSAAGTLLVAPSVCASTSFTSVGTLTGPCSGVGLGDADGDGDTDVFASGTVGVANSLWLNDGGGRFTAASGMGLGAGPSAPVFLDVNGDGRLDVPAAGHLSAAGPSPGARTHPCCALAHRGALLA